MKFPDKARSELIQKYGKDFRKGLPSAKECREWMRTKFGTAWWHDRQKEISMIALGAHFLKGTPIRSNPKKPIRLHLKKHFICKPYTMDFLTEILRYLEGITIPKNSDRKSTIGASARTVSLGLVHRLCTKYHGYSRFTERHPKLWKLLCDYGKHLGCDFTTVTVNEDVQCLPHRDRKNVGLTTIVGLGDYTGGELYVKSADGKEVSKVCVKGKPYKFNAYMSEHWTAPFTGKRYTLMFYRKRKSSKLKLKHRKEDLPIINEVYYGNQYHSKIGKVSFGIEVGDLWIDIGAHIGSFSLKAIENGAKCICYEPSPDNRSLLRENVQGAEIFPYAVTYGGSDVCFKTDVVSHSHRITTDPKGCINVKGIKFSDVISDGCCVKMDIEGAEFEILDKCDFTGIKKMVIAYHTHHDRSKQNLLKRLERLKGFFSVVHTQDVSRLKDEIRMFPNEIIIYCLN